MNFKFPQMRNQEKIKFIFLLTFGSYLFGYWVSLAINNSSNISEFLLYIDVALVGLIIMIIGLNKGVAYGSNKNNP